MLAHAAGGLLLGVVGATCLCIGRSRLAENFSQLRVRRPGMTLRRVVLKWLTAVCDSTVVGVAFEHTSSRPKA